MSEIVIFGIVGLAIATGVVRIVKDVLHRRRVTVPRVMAERMVWLEEPKDHPTWDWPERKDER